MCAHMCAVRVRVRLLPAKPDSLEPNPTPTPPTPGPQPYATHNPDPFAFAAPRMPLPPHLHPQLPYTGLGVQIVLECTGEFLTRAALQPYFDKGVAKVCPKRSPPPLHAARPPIQTWQLALLDLQTLTLPSKPRPCLPSNLQTLTLHAWLGVLWPRPITAPRLPLFLPLPSHRITAAQSQDYCHRIIEHHDMTLQAKPAPCPLPPLPPAPTPSPAPRWWCLPL